MNPYRIRIRSISIPTPGDIYLSIRVHYPRGRKATLPSRLLSIATEQMIADEMRPSHNRLQQKPCATWHRFAY